MYIIVGQKLAILKICLTIVKLVILGNLEAAPEETTYATQGADQGLKLKLGTVLEVLTSHSLDTSSYQLITT